MQTLHAPISAARGMWFLPLTPETHPFVTCANALLHGASRDGAADVLRSYRRLVPQSTFAEWTGIGDPRSPLAIAPRHCIPLPWRDRTMAEQRAIVRRQERQDARECGVPRGAVRSWLRATAGPQRCEDHGVGTDVERLSRLIGSICRHGFRDTEGDEIGAWLLVDDEGGRPPAWQVEGGQHRVAVAAALGIEDVPVRVRGVIRRDDAPDWPGVGRHYFSVDEASEVFDLALGGGPLPSLTPWQVQLR
jgi:hypothetical protein